MQLSTDSVSFAPAIINVAGTTKVERQLSVVRHAHAATQLALVTAPGKVGKAAREGAARSAHEMLASKCADNNYRPIAEYIAARLGEPIVISNRAAFESLGDQFEARIMKVKLSKSGGYTTDKKTGLQKPNATLAGLMTMKAELVEIVARVEEIHATRRAEREARALTDEAAAQA
jgi:hypothetical protein